LPQSSYCTASYNYLQYATRLTDSMYCKLIQFFPDFLYAQADGKIGWKKGSKTWVSVAMCEACCIYIVLYFVALDCEDEIGIPHSEKNGRNNACIILSKLLYCL